MKYRIPVAQPYIGDEELQKVTEAVKSGWISSRGSFIEEFERQFSSYIGAKYGVAVFNGTVALHLALKALGIGEGSEVILPALTFVATANAATYTGAEPVFVDSHPDYWCVDPRAVERNITEKTKAIIVVHLYGHPCDMDPILELAGKYGVYVIEDCAEAHGALYKGRRVGSFGVISCFSFYGNKIITTGEGGMCLTSNHELAEKMRTLRNQGVNPDKQYWHDIIGFNYRMTNLQAAIGVAQMSKIDKAIARKRHIANRYRELLGDERIVGPPEMQWAKSVYWLYSILLERDLRDSVIESLARQGIESRPFFHPIHCLPPYKTDLRLQIAEELSARGLSLPSGPNISEDDVDYVSSSLNSILKDMSEK